MCKIYQYIILCPFFYLTNCNKQKNKKHKKIQHNKTPNQKKVKKNILYKLQNKPIYPKKTRDDIMNIIFTNDQIFLLILAIIFLIAIIVIVIEWRKTIVSKNDIILLEKQAELKKIELVEKDIANKQRKENLAELSEKDQEKLKEIRLNTSEITAKVGLLSTQLNERVEQLEAKNELVKLQKLTSELDKKEKELNDLLNKQ